MARLGCTPAAAGDRGAARGRPAAEGNRRPGPAGSCWGSLAEPWPPGSGNRGEEGSVGSPPAGRPGHHSSSGGPAGDRTRDRIRDRSPAGAGAGAGFAHRSTPGRGSRPALQDKESRSSPRRRLFPSCPRLSLSLSRSRARFAFARALGRRDLVCDLTHSGPFISVWPDLRDGIPRTALSSLEGGGCDARRAGRATATWSATGR